MNTAAPEFVSAELVPAQSRTLFRTDDPVEVLDHARQVASALKTALAEGGMVMKIGKSEHVLIDGWQTLGAMLGVAPHVIWSRPLDARDNNGAEGWEARAEARTVDGRVVGSGEAMVTRAERNWRNADDYALRSMAQTRAMSKALRGPLGFVVALGGLNTTPAEELDATPAAGGLPDWAADIPEEAIDRFGNNIKAILAAANVLSPDEAANAVGNRVVTYCDGTIPAACALLAHQLAQLLDPTGASK